LKAQKHGTSDYTSDHEWLVIENNIAILGITNYPQEALGKIVCLESPDVWAVLKRRRNNSCGVS
jgi:glycine cleavage system H protein